MSILTKLSQPLLVEFLISYDKHTNAGFLSHLGFKPPMSSDAKEMAEAYLTQFLYGSLETLIDKADSFVKKAIVADAGSSVPSIENYWEGFFCNGKIGEICEMVFTECAKYREDMLKKGDEEIYRNAYYINTVENANYFFQEMQEHNASEYDEDLGALISEVLKGSFILRFIGEWVNVRSSVDVSDCESTGNEIMSYCETCVSAQSK